MGMISAMREWPWVLRATFAVVLLGMGLAIVSIVTGSDDRWMYAAAPAAFAVFGVLLALDVSDSATKYASSIAKYRPMGVDYSNSLYARPGFVRVFGALMVLVAGGMLIAAPTQPL